MFEGKTFEYILKEMLNRVPTKVDKREGSILYDALAPTSAELAQMYINLEGVLQESFGDTASRQYLILRAKERGLTPFSATYAVGKGVFNVEIPIGTRFSMDRFNYTATERLSEKTYKLTCETAGAEPNYYIGSLIPIDFVEGLTTAELTEILIPAVDEEETEIFRQRYFDSFDNQAFGGNRADYIKKVTAIAGVGGVKVYRAWKGGGTVKLVIVNNEFQPPSTELLQEIQTIIDPTVNGGEGLGIAPIDHVVTVFGVGLQEISIETTITYATGWDFEEAKPYIENALDSYFSELNATWASLDNIIVRVSQIESRLLDLDGVLDIENTKINGVQGNFVVDGNSVVKRGDFIG
ncbi:MAG: baseplate J/gp47 family protein [Anaerotignaceae bacterium]